jgi:glycosyltransferase involved in cell wall biosynthesis
MAPFLGGAEVAAERLAVGLLEAGHEVFLLLGQEGVVLEHMRRAGLRCIVSPMYFTDKWHWLRYRRARNALKKILLRERPDVLHNNDLTTHQILSDAARGLEIPRICHHRFCYEQRFTQWLSKYGAEHHLFVSRALMDQVCSQEAHWSTKTRAVVYDGLPLPSAVASDAREIKRRELGLERGQLIVTFAGQVIERKGVKDLLHAWALLEPRLRRQAELVIVGDDLDGRGKYRIEMEKLSISLALQARFIGFSQNVGDWLLASDVAVVPSHLEPLGNATLEAMSWALPVIGCAVGGIPEMIVPEETGLLVPPRNPEELSAALTRLLRDGGARTEFGLGGRQRCERLFGLQAHVKAIVVEYRRAQKHAQPVEVL